MLAISCSNKVILSLDKCDPLWENRPFARFFENLVLAIMRYSNLLAIRSSFYYSFIIEHHEVITPNAHSVTAKRKYWRKCWLKYHTGNVDSFRKFDLVLRIIKFDASRFLYGRVAIFSVALEETSAGWKLPYCLTHRQVVCLRETALL